MRTPHASASNKTGFEHLSLGSMTSFKKYPDILVKKAVNIIGCLINGRETSRKTQFLEILESVDLFQSDQAICCAVCDRRDYQQ